MFRALFLVIKLLVVGLVCAWLIYNPGLMHIEWLGYVIDTTVAIIILGLMLLIFTVSSLWYLVGSVVKLPWSIKNYFNKQKKNKETQALYAALIAWEQRDEHYFQKAIQHIKNNDKASGLVIYLEALHARMIGNDVTAQHKLRSLTLLPAFEQLGHVALLHQSLLNGKLEQCWENYLHLPKNTALYSPLLEQIFEIALQFKHFEDANNIIDKLKKHRSLTIDHIRQLRGRVALQKSIHFEHEQQNLEAAFVAAQEAYNLDPAPSTALRLMQILLHRGEIKKIKNILRFLWEESPVREMTVYLEKLEPDVNQLAIYNLLKKWSENLPYDFVRNTILTKWAIKAQLWGEARLHIIRFPNDKHDNFAKNKLLGDLALAENRNHVDAIQHYTDAFKSIESYTVGNTVPSLSFQE